MSLRQFLNCAYTLIVDAFRDIGNDLLTASEKANASLGLAVEPPVEDVEAGNAAALQGLMQATAGL